MDEPLEDSQPVEAESQPEQPESQHSTVQPKHPPTDAQEPTSHREVVKSNPCFDEPPVDGGVATIKPRRGGRASLNRGPLTEKQECPDCNKLLSKHSLIYNTHKCAAKKKIVIENIAPPPTETVVVPPLATKNYIDLDGDIDYDHQHIHNLVHGYFRHSKDKERAQKQEKFRSMLAGRL